MNRGYRWQVENVLSLQENAVWHGKHYMLSFSVSWVSLHRNILIVNFRWAL